MKKIFSLLLMLGVAATLAFAAPAAPPYPTVFWLHGKIDNSVAKVADLSGFKAVFYMKDPASPPSAPVYISLATALSDSSGVFCINAMDDLGLLPLTTAASTYYVGIVKKDVAGTSYGVNETNFTFTSADLLKGYVDLTLTLKAGEGIPDTGITISTVKLDEATEQVFYTQMLDVSNGKAPYSWSVSGLPSGLSIDPINGFIFGSPADKTASASPYTITISVTDADKKSDTKTYSLVVNPAGTLTITTPNLPDGTEGVSYWKQIEAVNGALPLNWGVTSGLPKGLSIDSLGVISGTPQVGTASIIPYNVIVNVTDASSKVDTKTFDLTISATGTLTITNPGLVDGTEGLPYSQTMSAVNATGAVNWFAKGLPAKLSINSSSGLISGTPDKGTASPAILVTITATDSKTSVSANYFLTINPSGTITITTASLNRGIEGTTYSQDLTVANGTPPYTWTQSGLPTGLSLSMSGTISGAPASGTASSSPYTVAITVTDSAGKSDSQTYDLYIDKSTITIIDTGRIRQTWIERSGSDVILHWNYDKTATAVNIYVKSGGVFTRNALDYSTLLATVPSGTTSYKVTGATALGTNYYRVVPEPLVNPDMMADENNSLTVAKITTTIPKGFSLLGFPLALTSSSGDPANFHLDQNLNTIIGDQLEERSSIYSWNMAWDPDPLKWKLDKATYFGGNFGAPPPFELQLAKGYWVYRQLDFKADTQDLIIQGIVVNSDFASQVKSSFNLVAPPYPVNYQLSTAGLGTGPAEGDSLYSWNGKSLDKYYYQGGWKDKTNTLVDPNFLSGSGYWYYKKLDPKNKTLSFDWKLLKP